jgi:hypothetical protein
MRISPSSDALQRIVVFHQVIERGHVRSMVFVMMQLQSFLAHASRSQRARGKGK